MVQLNVDLVTWLAFDLVTWFGKIAIFRSNATTPNKAVTVPVLSKYISMAHYLSLFVDHENATEALKFDKTFL